MSAGTSVEVISEKANNLLRGRRDKKLLEAGCGSASHFKFDDIVKMVGIDIDDDQLEKNTILHEKIRGDLETFPLPKGEYDIVICWDVIEHLAHPQDALRNMFNTVKPGGLLILGFPHLLSFKGLVTKTSPFWFHQMFYRYMKYTTRHFPTYLRTAILPKRIIKLAEADGFSVALSVLNEGAVTQKVRKRFWILDASFRITDAVWRIVTLGKVDSLFMDSCILILQKNAGGPAGT